MINSIRIDISRLCEASRQAVLDELEASEADGSIIALGSLIQVTQAVTKILPKGYVVAESTDEPTTLAVLKEGNIEQLGLYLCGYCATVFHNEVERNLHQRAHFFGFG